MQCVCGCKTFSHVDKLIDGIFVLSNMVRCEDCKGILDRRFPVLRLYERNHILTLEFYLPGEPKRGEAFRQAFYSKMPMETGWFHQGGINPDRTESDWHLFEFWTVRDKLHDVIKISKEIAKELRIEFTNQME